MCPNAMICGHGKLSARDSLRLPLYFINFQVPPDFAIVQNTCVTYVPLGGTCAISLVFRPTSSGMIGEYLYISGNMNYVYAQALIGNGI